MAQPLVTVICLCYNQERFVYEALNSIISQTYKNIEIIIADDASTDSSRQIIESFLKDHPSATYIRIETNIGNCRAFNYAFRYAKGDYIVDFAADDVMLPNRIEQQINFFQSLDGSYGVVFTDALYINSAGQVLRQHYPYLFSKGLLKRIPQGNVYADVLSTYFIASPTMMAKKKVFEELDGYDEQLSYEDFDFWVRSARNWKYAYLPTITTRIRKSERSMSTGWYKQGDRQLYSTYLVCKKALLLNRTKEDTQALVKRLRYEIRQSVFSENHKEAKLFYDLLQETGEGNLLDNLLMAINKLQLPLGRIRKLYHRMRYGV